MNAQDQIKERATEAADKFCAENEYQMARHELALLRSHFVDALTAQQTAAASAHREEVERLTKERDAARAQTEDALLWREQLYLAVMFGGEAGELAPRDVKDACEKLNNLRAESAKLREVLGKVTLALNGFKARVPELMHRGSCHKWLRAVAECSCGLDAQYVLCDEALALAATVLKEDSK